ncbi:hypothetical protein H310_09799 [Aphanomyces invadans]|uniref:Uncharacterized protein n=1 Tax=Aphanomyces invadans TaxID=157072 RepID=A0A024TUF4_9STRA|nr:hypothetical protein H310_09799 [Aphanomyces invadans]ETV96937.1 hypothetical protein H310_09799 [Aphanomyces invadans]|eukprot:XP_008874183.1 hypothetical protein H310_09799 [Aphanomyces invadans]
MHTTVCLYLAMWIVVTLFSRGVDVAVANAYSPITVMGSYAVLCVLHVHAVMATLFPKTIPSMPMPSKDRLSTLSSGMLLKVKVTPHQHGPRAPTTPSILMTDEIQDCIIIAFNLFEVGCQSHQAFAMFQTLVEPVKVISYGLVVTKSTLLNLADTIVSFTLSTGHPLFSLIITVFHYLVLEPTLAQDNLWATRSTLLTRLLVPSSAFDMLCKLDAQNDNSSSSWCA